MTKKNNQKSALLKVSLEIFSVYSHYSIITILFKKNQLRIIETGFFLNILLWIVEFKYELKNILM